MLKTAENVTAKHGISTAEQHEVVLRREQQYRDCSGRCSFLAFHDAAVRGAGAEFQSRRHAGKREGVSTSTKEGLAVETRRRRRSVWRPDPSRRRHAAIVVTTREKARELSTNPKIAVRLHGFGMARALAYTRRLRCLPQRA
jgi:hypothetical protein